MPEKRFLIHLDILGFEKLAEKIAFEKRIEASEVRAHFVEVIQKKISNLETAGDILGKNYEARDDWILVTDSFGSTVRTITEILDHDTKYTGYEQVPLEIAIGVGEYGRWAKFEAKDLVTESPTIAFLKTKTDIIYYYRTWYKENENGRSPTTTFVVLTAAAHNELEPLDKKIFEKLVLSIPHSGRTLTFYVANVDRLERRGKVFDFSDQIKCRGNKWYERIDETFVFPIEFEDMVQSLKEKRILFITGTPEYGKTFTAIRLMWDFYLNGYSPKLVRGGELTERVEARKRLENIRAELKPKHIIYFEDPFGKYEYERMEILEREIGVIISQISRIPDVYVIITSREEIFKEFKKEKISSTQLEQYEKRLNIKNPSYDLPRRMQMLLNWAEEENCRWLNSRETLEQLFRMLREDNKLLTTPLSIRDLAVATAEIENISELKTIVHDKSIEAVKGFAREIKNMADDKKIFLSFLFIPCPSCNTLWNVGLGYANLIRHLNITQAWSFDRVLNWFKNDKINLIYNYYLEFSHSSYYEALGHLLVEDGYKTKFGEEIFFNVLLHAARLRSAVGAVSLVIARYFNELSEDAGCLLFRISEDSDNAEAVATAVARYFKRLPENVRNLLFELAGDDKTVGGVSVAITRYFGELPKTAQSLLYTISENDEGARSVIGAVSRYFYELPPEVRNNILLKLSVRKSAAKSIAMVVARYFQELPDQLRVILSKYSESAATSEAAAMAIAQYFHELPKDVRRLLFRLSDNSQTAEGVAWAIFYYFDILPRNVRNRIIYNLAEIEKKNAWAIAVVKAFAHGVDIGFLWEKGLLARQVSLADAMHARIGKMLGSIVKDMSASKNLSNKEKALDLIEVAWSGLQKPLAIKILRKLCRCGDEHVRNKATKLLNVLEYRSY